MPFFLEELGILPVGPVVAGFFVFGLFIDPLLVFGVVGGGA